MPIREDICGKTMEECYNNTQRCQAEVKLLNEKLSMLNFKMYHLYQGMQYYLLRTK